MDIFQPSDSKWVRNVRVKDGANWAYDSVGETFDLHWSSTYKDKKEAEKPQYGDLILLFQRPDKVTKGTYLTHLVTPTSHKAKDDYQNRPDYRWAREVLVVGAPDNINAILKPIGTNFTKVSRTHSFKIDLIETGGVQNRELIQNIIWKEFLPYFRKDVEEKFLNLSVPLNLEELALEEGKEREVLRKHLVRERRSQLVTQKKKVNPEYLMCECCGFNFWEKYGNHGLGYIECHHRIPISKGQRITKLEDLALVCSNCHRMLHRRNSNGEYYSVEELGRIYKNEQHNK